MQNSSSTKFNLSSYRKNHAEAPRYPGTQHPPTFSDLLFYSYSCEPTSNFSFERIITTAVLPRKNIRKASEVPSDLVRYGTSKLHTGSIKERSQVISDTETAMTQRCMDLMSNFIKLIISERIHFHARNKRFTPAFLYFDLRSQFSISHCVGSTGSLGLFSCPSQSQ